MTFEMWSSSHYLFMFLPFIFLSVLFVFTKDRTREANRRIGIVLSVFAIIILILRNIEIWIGKSYRFDVELIPLQICHFANFVLLIALLTNRQTWFNFALILNLPAAMVSMIFANSLTNYSTIISFRGFAYIMGHALLVVIPLWLFMTGFVVLDQRIFKKTLVLVGLLYAGSVVLNNLMFVLFGQYSNYFYTMKPEKGTPLETFFDLNERPDETSSRSNEESRLRIRSEELRSFFFTSDDAFRVVMYKNASNPPERTGDVINWWCIRFFKEIRALWKG